MHAVVEQTALIAVNTWLRVLPRLAHSRQNNKEKISASEICTDKYLVRSLIHSLLQKRARVNFAFGANNRRMNASRKCMCRCFMVTETCFHSIGAAVQR